MDMTTDLAFRRTRLAAERTLMAWVRTALSLITFGFTIIKFFQFLRYGNDNIPMVAQPLSGTTKLGTFLILLGIFSLIPGIIEHYTELKSLNLLDKNVKRWSYALIFAILAGMIGVYAFIDGVAYRFF